jgi:ATP-dependent DNA helicase RecQ
LIPHRRLAARGPGEAAVVEDRIERVAREAFGFATLRPGQREAIESVLAGRDTLVVMSTGSGKSAIYQIAGLLTEGSTVVVSPLIALQRDQVEDLAERAAGGAAQLNSSLPASERERALAELAENALEFLLLAPEQLANDEVLAELAVARPSLLVVDEAHCISEWGHDFRPEYLRVGAAAEAMGRPAILALTATAAPPVRDEIVERLGLRDPQVLVRGFDRPNIRLAVERFHGEQGAERKLRALQDAVEAAPKPGIVYVATRRQAEELAASLCERGVTAASYHAGMRAAERDAVQERFMDSALEVVVATTAFGMGIDKADVRWVFHGEISESLDAYYQEIGRAGRDGAEAQAVLFYRSEDLGLRRFFAAGGHVEVDEIAQVLDAVAGAGEAVEPTALQGETDLSARPQAARGGVRSGYQVPSSGQPPSPGCRQVRSVRPASYSITNGPPPLAPDTESTETSKPSSSPTITSPRTDAIAGSIRTSAARSAPSNVSFSCSYTCSVPAASFAPAFASASCAFTRWLRKIGSTSIARMPTIRMTTSSSMSVKPRSS